MNNVRQFWGRKSSPLIFDYMSWSQSLDRILGPRRMYIRACIGSKSTQNWSKLAFDHFRVFGGSFSEARARGTRNTCLGRTRLGRILGPRHTDISEMRRRKIGQNWRVAISGSRPENRRCWVIRFCQHISVVKRNCPVEFE